MKKINRCLKYAAVNDGANYGFPQGGSSAICFADPSNLDSFSDSLNTLKGEIESCIGEMYGTINGMSDAGTWSGDVYEQFRTKCNSFKDSLQGYADVVGVFASQVLAISGEASALIESIKASCS